MQIFSYIHGVNKQLNRSLHEVGPDASQFQWYLAIQNSILERHDAENNVLIGNELPYKSIRLPSAPKASLYAQNKHFSQMEIHGAQLHTVKQPSLHVQFYNCLQPQNLASGAQAHVIPVDVYHNASLVAQNIMKEEGSYRCEGDYSLNDNSADNEHSEQSNIYTVNGNGVNTGSHLPTNDFVDSTFAAIQHDITF